MAKKLGSILDVHLKCPVCGWKGKLGSTFPDVDGDGAPGCPICFCNVIATKVTIRGNNAKSKQR